MKNALKALLSTVAGVKHVYAGMPKKMPQTMLPAIVIYTPKASDERVAGSAGFGKRKVTYTARISVFNVDTEVDAEASSLAFDDLIDAIESTIRTHPKLDDSGWPNIGIEWIRTDVAEAKDASKDGGNVFRLATIEFPIVDYVVG
jgi:hypothetical protein